MSEPVKEVSTVGQLRRSIAKEEIVSVSDINGTEFTFRIRKLPASSWLSKGIFGSIKSEDPKALGEVLSKSVESPSMDMMRSVILKSVVEPKITELPGNDSIGVDEIMSSDIISIKLYERISALALREFGKVEAASGRPSDPVPS